MTKTAKWASVELIDHPGYRAWENQWNELHRERNAVEAQIQEVQEERRNKPRHPPVRAKALALLDGGDIEDARDPDAELRGLTEHRDVLDEAIRLHRERKVEIVAEASIALCTGEVQEEYEQIVFEIAGHLVPLGRACNRERRMIDQLTSRGIEFSGVFQVQPLQMMRLGGPDDTKAVAWLRAAHKDIGIELPEELRP